MKQNNLLTRIITDPNIMMGKPTIKGTRLTAQHILGLLAQGMTTQEILDEYNNLSAEDIFACLLFATKALDSSVFMPLSKNDY